MKKTPLDSPEYMRETARRLVQGYLEEEPEASVDDVRQYVMDYLAPVKDEDIETVETEITRPF